PVPLSRILAPPRQIHGGDETKQVAVGAEARDLPGADGRHHRAPPERLARVDVGQVHLDGGQPDGRNGVAQRVAVVGERAGINDDGVKSPAGAVKRVDELAFVVRLEKLHFGAQLGGRCGQHALDVRERRVPVYVRLARAEQVQVRTVQHQDLQFFAVAAHMLRCSLSTSSTSSSGTSSRTTQRPVRSSKTNRSLSASTFLSRRMMVSSWSGSTAGGASGKPARCSKAASRSTSDAAKPVS